MRRRALRSRLKCLSPVGLQRLHTRSSNIVPVVQGQHAKLESCGLTRKASTRAPLHSHLRGGPIIGASSGHQWQTELPSRRRLPRLELARKQRKAPGGSLRFALLGPLPAEGLAPSTAWTEARARAATRYARFRPRSTDTLVTCRQYTRSASLCDGAILWRSTDLAGLLAVRRRPLHRIQIDQYVARLAARFVRRAETALDTP